MFNPTWASDRPDASAGISEGALLANALNSPRARQRAALLLSRIMGSTAQGAAHPSGQEPAQSSSSLQSCSLKAPSLEHTSIVCGSTCSRHAHVLYVPDLAARLISPSAYSPWQALRASHRDFLGRAAAMLD